VTADSPSVLSVVLNWNNYDDTARCLDSLSKLSYPSHRTLVVDNGSQDDSGARLDADYPDVEVVFNDDNLGFAGGMNRGIDAALDRGADYLWLLNNDLLVEDGLLDGLVDRMGSNPNLGVLSPIIMSYPDTDSVWFWRGSIDWRAGNAYHPRPPESFDDELLSTAYVPICCALYRSNVFEDVGRLSEDYFLYYEDVDFAVRMADAGYDLATDAALRAYHEQGGSSGSKLGPMYSYYNARNPLLFGREFSDRVGRLQFLALCPWLLKEVGHRTITGNVHGLVGLCRGIVDGLRDVRGRGPYP
jgi:GT2 family glycosyltransferase